MILIRGAKIEEKTEVVTDPSRMTGLAALRAKQAAVKADHSLIDRPEHIGEARPFRAHCPWCRAPNVVMSSIDPREKSTTSPAIGDAVKCDWCRKLHVVEQVNGHEVKTIPLPMEKDDFSF